MLALPHIASAQSLEEKLVGAYILAEEVRCSPMARRSCRGQRAVSNSSPTGRASFFVLPKERAKTDSVRIPASPMVAWYGSYTVDEAANTFTVTIEGANSPSSKARIVQTISFQDDTMTLTGSKVDTPEGPISP